MMKTKKGLILFLFFLCFITKNKANNINITNIVPVVNITGGSTLIQFDLSWENSFRTSTFESNWDAAWVFGKWRIQGTNVWNHLTLSPSGHTSPAGTTINTPSDNKGFFIYRSADGSGNNNWSVGLNWDHVTDGLNENSQVDVCLFAIEMVYIPQGSFYLGDGSEAYINVNFEAGTSTAPFLVTSEAAITLGGGGAGSLGNNNASGFFTAGEDFNDVTSQTLPAAFPKGYSAFYIMKYEITQEQYVEFLNKLSVNQQSANVKYAFTSSASGAAMTDYASSVSYRNGIVIATQFSGTTPGVYACDLDKDGIYNEANDGQNIACNYLTWKHVSSYLDWAALRPFTELEYEKACRGTIYPVEDEYAWGNHTTITSASAGTLNNSGQANEAANDLTANCLFCPDAIELLYSSGCAGNPSPVEMGFVGPMRVGSFADGVLRRNSGASYYGVMELSGNLWERVVTVSRAAGRSFTGVHGDGYLTTSGAYVANVSNWPAYNVPSGGVGSRGGSWRENRNYARVSSRYYSNTTGGSTEQAYYGGRGARTAP